MEQLMLTLIAFAVVLFLAWRGWMERNSDQRAPVLAERARIYVKETHTGGRFAPPDCYLYFFIPERDTVEECRVSAHIYDCLKKGDWGILTHQGGQFYSFQRNGEIFYDEQQE